MTRNAAHSLLNAAIAGMPISAVDILKALQATGDFDPAQMALQDVIEITHTVPQFTREFHRSAG